MPGPGADHPLPNVVDRAVRPPQRTRGSCDALPPSLWPHSRWPAPSWPDAAAPPSPPLPGHPAQPPHRFRRSPTRPATSPTARIGVLLQSGNLRFLVANADYVARSTGNDAVGAFLLDTGGTHQGGIAAGLRRQLGTAATVTDLTLTRSTVGSSLTSVDLAGLTRIELGFAVLLAAASGGLVLALGLAERRRTFAIATVLGATRRQLRGLVLTEAAALTAGGLAGGSLIGWSLSQMLVKVLTGVFDPPPATTAVPWTYLVLTAAAALNAARRSSRPAVEELREL
ncbi:ABC transporter permease [Streptomyces sp. NPDC090741]|uniref:ABC transporter permease n=1 Tax=Streptomyces sp. NPDC090741 TaxID=3365967 RepID=UPI00383047C9